MTAHFPGLIPLTQIHVHDRFLSCLGTGTSIKSGIVKLAFYGPEPNFWIGYLTINSIRFNFVELYYNDISTVIEPTPYHIYLG
jgi:hypothetical protein